MIKQITALSRYYTTLATDPEGYASYPAESRADKLAAQRLHASVYLERGYISERQINAEGKIDLIADPHQAHSNYFVVKRMAAGRPEVIVSARQIYASKSKRHKSFQTYADLKLDEAARKKLTALDPAKCVEISALTKVSGVSTHLTFLLYRAMWQFSITQGHQIWLMACDQRLYRRLKYLFGKAIQAVGEPQFYKGHTVVPAIIEIDYSVNQLIKNTHTLNPADRLLKLRLSQFFLRGLPEKYIRARMKSNTGFFVRFLWWTYGFNYDGLLSFWPYRNLLNQVSQAAGLRDGQAVLDLGCGTGNLIYKMVQGHRLNITGVDAAGSMLGVARRKLAVAISARKVELYQQDLTDFLRTARPNSFDRVVCVNVIYALNERQEFWQELFRVVKPTGKIIISTSVRKGSWPIIREHFRHSNLIELLRPRLIGVFLIDALINLLGRSGAFAFPDAHTLENEVVLAGGRWGKSIRTYGGRREGVNILVEIKP